MSPNLSASDLPPYCSRTPTCPRVRPHLNPPPNRSAPMAVNPSPLSLPTGAGGRRGCPSNVLHHVGKIAPPGSAVMAFGEGR
eukprot:6314535-Prymnesium_polylepis.1